MLDFSFGGHSLSSFGGRVLQAPVHTVAKRSITRIKIFGQSGDEIVDNGSYDNVDFSLQIGFFVHKTAYTAQQLARAVIDWLALLQDGYHEYRDSLNSGYFTRACLTNFEQVAREMRTLLTATLGFTRVPYWYLEDGTQAVKFHNGSNQNVLTNPEAYESEPLYRFYTARNGNETFNITVNGEAFHILLPYRDRSYYFDNAKKQFYIFHDDIVNGEKVYIGNTLLPDLIPGNNTINFNINDVFTQGSFYLEMTPNWRRL